MTQPVTRKLDPVLSASLALRIRQANDRMAASELVDDLDEDAFSKLVEEYFVVSTVADVLCMVKDGHIPKKHDHYGSPITLAAVLGLHDLIKPLHELGCAANLTTEDHLSGLNALPQAITNAKLDPTGKTVCNLLDIGATMTDARMSVLRSAIFFGHEHVVKALVQHGLDPDEQCRDAQETPLVTALYRLFEGADRLGVAMTLLDLGADPNLPNRTKFVKPDGGWGHEDVLPITVLAEGKVDNLSQEQIEGLLDRMIMHGLQLDIPDSNHPHPLAVCLRNDNDAVALALMKKGAHPSHATSVPGDLDTDTIDKEKTPFQLFAERNMANSVAFMLDHYKEDPEQTCPDGYPLVDSISAPETQAVLRSAITQKLVGATIDAGSEQATTTLRRVNPSMSL